MKNTLKAILFFFMLCNNAVAQQKGILLSSKTDDDTEFFRENKRVKIKTIDGKKHTGRIKIVDENTIMIDNDLIAMNTIIKIRSQSLLSAVLSAGFILIGGAFVVGGALAGGYAVLLIPVGLVGGGIGTLISAIGYNHKKHSWDYKIVMDYKK